MDRGFDAGSRCWQHGSMLQIWPVPVFSDNYVWILEREGSNRVVVVDPGDAAPVIEALDERDLEIAAILVTHHHRDHVGGLPELIRRYHPPVYGSAAEAVDGVDHPRRRTATPSPCPSSSSTLRSSRCRVTPLGHIGYLGAGLRLCRRHALRRRLRPGLRGHHGADARFADPTGRARRPRPRPTARTSTPSATSASPVAVEPGNTALADRLAAAEVARAADQPTVPSTIGLELETNPFLRCFEPSVIAAAGPTPVVTLEPGAEVFGVIRTLEGRVDEPDAHPTNQPSTGPVPDPRRPRSPCSRSRAASSNDVASPGISSPSSTSSTPQT